jgi:CPA2 family monovalent cation:H+ antiporter-2
MPHHTPLIATIVVGLTLAFALGAIAQRLRVSPIAGYLLAGIVIGAHTPGFVADQSLANQLAEIGVILLMFGVGLHFSLADLMSVRAIAVPGAIAQIAVATMFGIGLATIMGLPFGESIVFGLALSCASTVVLLRALQERRLLDTVRGRIAVGWLIVEDIVMVLALVLLPALQPILAGGGDGGPGIWSILAETLFTIAKVAIFVTVMLVVGRRLIPAMLHYIAHTGSRELFRLCVLAIALGVAYAAANLFGVSFALGAFFAGMVLSESELSQRAAEESLPLRDAFAVLFFVSVGMLFNPGILLTATWPVVSTVIIIVVGKSLAALLIVLVFGHSLLRALFISASLAQIGEFSFILAGLGIGLGLLQEGTRDLILAGSLISILLNPLLFLALDRIRPVLEARAAAASPSPEQYVPPLATSEVTDQENHITVIGYGPVGSRVADGLAKAGANLLVVDESVPVINGLREKGIRGLAGSAPGALVAANIAKASALVIAIPEVFEAGQIVEQARKANPGLLIVARGYSDAEVEHLLQCGATAVVLGAEEIADAMLEAFRREEVVRTA